MPPALSLTADRVRRALGARRRWLAAGFAAAAVAGGLHAVAPPPARTTEVLVAATDLRGGAPLRPDQVETVAMPDDVVPHGALTAVEAVAGRLLAGPVRAGEPLTDLRVVGAALVDGYGAGRVAAPVRIADAGAARLLRSGDVVDVLAAGSTETSVVAAGAPVIVVPEAAEAAAGSTQGALVVLAVDPGTARDLAQAATLSPLSVSVRG